MLSDVKAFFFFKEQSRVGLTSDLRDHSVHPTYFTRGETEAEQGKVALGPTSGFLLSPESRTIAPLLVLPSSSQAKNDSLS